MDGSQAKNQTSKTKSICSYCEESKYQSDMTDVPRSKDMRQKWIEILGYRFAENTKCRRFPRICRSHFNVENDLNYRKPQELPIKMSEEEEENVVRNKERDESSNMTRVPSNQITRQKWIDILGKRFAKNLSKIQQGLICRAHFEGNLNVRRRTYQLPIRMGRENELNYYGGNISENSSENENHRVEIVENESDDMEFIDVVTVEREEMETEQNENLNFQQNFIIEKDSNNVLENIERPEEIMNNEIDKADHHQSKNGDLENRDLLSVKIEQDEDSLTGENRVKIEAQQLCEPEDEGIQIIVPIKTENSINTSECRVCGIISDVKSMTPIPKKTSILLKWFKILGSVFFDNINSNNSPHFICYFHLRHILDQLCKEF
ncbi:unnamed protein product [Caenorhabditis angaria]|uniref:THAP-type domain-containing protein n=1 Tax=Caenorhabditis angaria TaxID=860376 RepID=A0A9P1MXJ3_9PELO|nr:unnamed protein product [Caenorhabditis angaria]